MARRKSKNDIRGQRHRIYDEIINRAQDSFKQRYPQIVKAYQRNYRDPAVREAYKNAQAEYRNSDEFKRMQSRAERVLHAEDRYIKNIEKSKEYKALSKETAAAQDEYDNTPYNRGDASHKNNLARRANDLEHRKNTDTYSRETYMGKANVGG